ncbi:unnamed protein product [Effrenium voratum]|nr:unnamed protein product [Effrenium voratum]
MTQKCGGRILTEEEVHWNVLRALDLDEKKDLRRLGKEYDERKVDAVDNVCGEDGKPLLEMDAIVLKNKTSATNSLSQTEWQSMEAAMPAEERQTHRNLQVFFMERAKAAGVKEQKEEEEEDDPEELALLGDAEMPEGQGEDSGDEEEDPRDAARKKQEEEDKEAVGTVEKAKNWSSVNLVFQESKLNYRGSFTAGSFTNWLWYRVVRPKLEETKSKLPELSDEEIDKFSIQDVEEVLGEFMPAQKKKDEKEDKKDKKDKKDDKDKKDKKDKKEEDDKKDKKKDSKDKKKKKDAIQLNAKEKLQVQNLIKNMIYGESGKNKTITTGWVNLVDEKDIPRLTPWEFQLAHIMRSAMALEYTAKKKKEVQDLTAYYEMCQSLADAIGFIKKQYSFEFPQSSAEDFLPLKDALDLQKRFREGSVVGAKFDLLWYLQNGAHLLAGSGFAKKHRTTVFKPFKIQELVTDAILQPGPQLVFAIAPPGTGKTAVVAHILNLFPVHTLVFCCPALPVVLSVGRISNSLGIPYAFCKGRRITPSYSCGRGLATHVDMPAEGDKPPQTAVESLRYMVAKLNLERKKKRLAEKKRKRNLHDLKRFPRIFLMCDSASAAWLLRQLDPNRTILVVDEPPMGSDVYPDKPEDNPLACAMMQTMMTPMYKTVLMSATLPRPEALPTLVNSFLERFKIPDSERDLHVRECMSTELDRGAVMCGPSGAVAFPHQNVQTADELKRLCERLPADPLVLKAYTERALATLLLRWRALEKDGKLKDGFKKQVVLPEDKFSDLSELHHASIRSYAMDLLTCVAKQEDDEFAKAFCCPDTTGDNLFPQFDLSEMLFGNAYAFPGLTLVADDHPLEQMLKMSENLQAQFPRASDIEADIKKQEESAVKEKKFKEDDEQQEEAPQMKLKFSPDLVIQSEQFLKRWCPKRPAGAHTIPRVLPTVNEFKAIKNLPVDERWQMLALAGAGSFDPKLDSDPSNPVYTQWVHESMTQNKLACVTAGKEFTWGANVPASTVVASWRWRSPRSPVGHGKGLGERFFTTVKAMDLLDTRLRLAAMPSKVTKSFAETTSVAGMLQYVGRAARRGLTTHGQAIFERDEDLQRIFASPDGLSTEALTMERYAEWWKSRGKAW